MAYNPYNYTAAYMQQKQGNPTQYNYSFGLVDPGMAQAELIGDKIASYAMLRWTDDDYVTYSKFRTIDLDLERSRTRRLGNFSRRSFEVLHVKDKNFRMEALEIEGN